MRELELVVGSGRVSRKWRARDEAFDWDWGGVDWGVIVMN
jgi:hypothetical protein